MKEFDKGCMCDVTFSSCISDLLFFHLQYVSFIKELDGEVDVIACRIFQNHMQQYFFTQVNHYSSENLLRNIALEFGFRNAVCNCQDTIWLRLLSR